MPGLEAYDNTLLAESVRQNITRAILGQALDNSSVIIILPYRLDNTITRS